jgi:hypothetical protein
MALVRTEVSRDRYRLWFAQPKDRDFRQDCRRAAAWSRQAVFGTTMARRCVVPIDLDVQSSGRHGERFCVPARLAVRADLKIQRKPDENNAGRREPRQLPALVLPVRPSDHSLGAVVMSSAYATG